MLIKAGYDIGSRMRNLNNAADVCAATITELTLYHFCKPF